MIRLMIERLVMAPLIADFKIAIAIVKRVETLVIASYKYSLYISIVAFYEAWRKSCVKTNVHFRS